MWPKHCVQGSIGSEYIDSLDIDDENDIEVLKGQLKYVDSYSAFGGDGEETYLAWDLRERNVKKVFCVGLAYDFCVGRTALSAAQEGFETYIIMEGTKSVNSETESVMRNLLEKVNVMSIDLETFYAEH